MMRISACVVLALVTSACAQFPEVDNATPPGAEVAAYPDLVPLDPLIDEVAATQTDIPESEAQLEARVASLQARANALRGSVLGSSDRRRLEESLQ
ncbi:hypothetical protein KX928_11840 [Roseobacter sp. YSTF-M11]|uniref:Uncharacterized protein n=1 Tax=Roseobacter insulae TaxID=2859783 RepID=A0A9X1FVF0_9RHOB|nr:hypothetical protein [Roseobacter insulae]MBW4708474.1 hypothetical protein [Roseobacter insulae]